MHGEDQRVAYTPARHPDGKFQKGIQPPGGGGAKAIYTDEYLSDLAKKLKKWVDKNIKKTQNFLLSDFAFEYGILPNDFVRFAKKHEEFNDSYQWAKAWQEHMLVKGSLYNKINQKTAHFMLGCNHGWKTNVAPTEKMVAFKNDFAAFLSYMKEDGEPMLSEGSEEDQDEDDDR